MSISPPPHSRTHLFWVRGAWCVSRKRKSSTQCLEKYIAHARSMRAAGSCEAPANPAASSIPRRVAVAGRCPLARAGVRCVPPLSTAVPAGALWRARCADWRPSTASSAISKRRLVLVSADALALGAQGFVLVSADALALGAQGLKASALTSTKPWVPSAKASALTSTSTSTYILYLRSRVRSQLATQPTTCQAQPVRSV
jgi:hypothetical protein